MVRLSLIRLCSSAKSYNLPTYLSENQRITVQKPKYFVDSIKLIVEGGNGGTGLPQFGGQGGNGGNIIFKCNPKLDSLKKLQSIMMKKKNTKRKNFKAENGEDSFKYKLIGDNGKDLTISCPPGCTLYNSEGGRLGDIDQDDDEIVVPIGGEGGCKENNYIGRTGSKMMVNLDLKLISDIGLIGFPNAGKSTLLKALTRAKPKIANFPFTTITPNIGIVEYRDYRKISIADLPGLIKGAHLDIGLGHRFLKHILRTQLLMFVISAEQMKTVENEKGYSPIEILLTLIKEIELYDEMILKKPSVLLFSKFDLPDATDMYDKFLNDLDNVKKLDFSSVNLKPDYIPERMIDFNLVLPISSKNSHNIKNLRDKIREIIDSNFEVQAIKSGSIQTFEESQEKLKSMNKRNEEDAKIIL